MLTTEQIKQTVSDYFKDKPVKKVYLFGSYARGEANEESDVDLLVDLDYEKEIGWQFFGWNDELKDIMNIKVDVVSSRGLSNFLAPFIHGDKKLIYAK
jgi:predicted nucleotidyltransferase